MIINKLVRDNIPKIIEKQGNKCSYKILNNEEYNQALNEKLKEELNEYLENENIEELADLQEVINAILQFKGVDKTTFEQIREEKCLKNGSFSQRIYLLEKR